MTLPSTWSAPSGLEKAASAILPAADFNAVLGDIQLMPRRIARTAVGTTGAASIDFTGVPTTYSAVELLLSGRGDTTGGAFTVVNLQFNADAGANYDAERAYTYGAVPALGGSESIAGTAMGIGFLAGSLAPASVADQVVIKMAGYGSTILNKAVVATGTNKLSTATGNFYATAAAGWWRSNAAVNQITLTPSTGNFAEGTVATLIGIP